MSEYKFQHYVPRKYLEAWENNKHHLHVFMKDINREFYKATDKILGENDLYTLKSDDLYALSDNDRLIIFGELLNYNIVLDGKPIENVYELSMNYNRFCDWEIVSKDGSDVNKQYIKSKIDQKRILEIEKGWHIIEGEWGYLRDKIEKVIYDGSYRLKKEDGQNIIKFIVTQKSRNISKKKELRNLIDSILNFMKTNDNDEEYSKIIEEFTESYFLKNIRKYQHEDENSTILKEQNLMMRLHMVFYKSSGGKNFLTSDNPVFAIIDKNFYKGKLIGLYFPISPNIIVGLYRGDEYKYTINCMPVNMMKRINKYIIINSEQFYIKYDK